MPHTESAKKRLRQNEKRRLRNKARTTELKSVRKQVQRALHDGQPDQAAESARLLTKKVDQAAAKGTVHKNKAARWKSRIAKAVNKAKATAAAPKA
ncbi:30S ribosomal protein S20 [Planctomycetota bacterium]|nr:30S ribosomal protein S20 [Planctomycetota bacterium]